MPAVHIHLSPALVAPEAMRGGTVIVIDLIRASTTMAWALGNGASRVLPCESVEEARALHAEHPGSLLGGERHGLRIDGFDLGNSPGEYTRERVSGKTIVFTTTNGTQALKRAGEAARVLVGSLANHSATVQTAAADLRTGRDVHLLCAGIHDEVCFEDTLCAGAFAAVLLKLPRAEPGNDCVALAVAAWREHSVDSKSLRGSLRRSQGGRNLAEVGLEADLDDVARQDVVQLVLEIDQPGSIRGLQALP